MYQVAEFFKVSFGEFQKAIKEFLPHLSDEDISKIYESIELPRRATCGSAGYDFYLPVDICLKPRETIKIPTGIRCKIDDGWFLAMMPKSGLGFKYRMQLDNTVGVIDSDYYFSSNEGHIFVKLTNDSTAQKIISLDKGEAFCQGVFLMYGIVKNEDEITEIRNGGFGSTSKKNKC